MTAALRKAYLVGGGIGTLAAAAFMIRDGGIPGDRITIVEAGAVMGGSLDGSGDAATGYLVRGGRMLTTDNYECTWGLFKTIPSLQHLGQSVYDETLDFNAAHRSHATARLIDHLRARVPVTSMGFTMHDRKQLLAVVRAAEEDLGCARITDWLSPAFFGTPFWTLWATTFAFQPWHSAVEFKRYLHRFMLEFTRIETLAGVKRTIYNQYDSLVRPLQQWLEGHGVRMRTGCTVTAADHAYHDGLLGLTHLHIEGGPAPEVITLDRDDLVIIQNGSMTDASSIGSMTDAPRQLTKGDSGGWRLWESLAQDCPQIGNPAAFNSCIAQSCWESFTVTLTNSRFFELMQEFTGDPAGTGGLVTFQDSNWLMSIVLAHQPHFIGQPHGVDVFWGYGLHPDRVGNFVAKPMSACNGAEILTEVYGHLRFDAEPAGAANCIPCRMPYITSMFMPRSRGDRPAPVPEGTRNLAFVSQFVEIAEDVVFTVEYSVRAAQLAVYQLLAIDRPVPAVTPHDKSWHTQFDALLKAFA